MDEFASMRAFVEVVESGTFSAAARKNNSSVSSIGRQVKALEDSLGTRLLTRTTRSIALTEVGAHFFQRSQAIIRQFDAAKREAISFHSTMAGTLRVYLRVTAAQYVIVPAIPRFVEQFPDMSIEILLGDAHINLITNQIDVAVWLGHLEDSSMIVRRLTPTKRVLCASPKYIEKHGAPKTLDDLKDHACLLNSVSHNDGGWWFTRDGERVHIPVSSRFCSNTGSVIMTAAEQGLGLAVVHSWMARSAFRDGTLVPLLEGYEISPTDADTSLYAVYPHAKGLSRRARAFIDFLVEIFKNEEI